MLLDKLGRVQVIDLIRMLDMAIQGALCPGRDRVERDAPLVPLWTFDAGCGQLTALNPPANRLFAHPEDPCSLGDADTGDVDLVIQLDIPPQRV